MSRTMRILLFLLLFVSLILLRYSQGFAVVPYNPIPEAGTEVQMTAQSISGLNEKFQKHEQEHIQSLNAIKSELMQIKEKEYLIIRDNILLKRVSVVLFLLNLFLMILLLRSLPKVKK